MCNSHFRIIPNRKSLWNAWGASLGLFQDDVVNYEDVRRQGICYLIVFAASLEYAVVPGRNLSVTTFGSLHFLTCCYLLSNVKAMIH